jgi:hypothetical protein
MLPDAVLACIGEGHNSGLPMSTAGGTRAGIPLPSAEIDASGRVFVVWSDARFENGTASDVVMSTSDDGATWSPVTRIPADPVGSGVDHLIPGLAVDRSTSGGIAQLASSRPVVSRRLR